MASSSDEVPTKPFPLSNSKKLPSFDSVPNPNYQERIRRKKPKSKSKSKSKTNKQRRRRRHSSSSSDSDSDDYSTQKREKPKKKKRKKEKELAKPDKKKKIRNKKRRHDTPSPTSTSPLRRPKSRKRRRSPSPSPSRSTCSSRGRSPSRDESREERAHEPLHETEERWEDRDKIIEAYDDCPPARNDERLASVLGDARFASVVGSANDDMAEQEEEEEEKSVGVGNARLASVVVQADHDMVVVEEGKSAGSGDNAGKDAVDLELILRQKALENFRKFRGGLSANKESGKAAVNPRVRSSVEGGSMPSHPVKVHGSSDGRLLEQCANKGSLGYNRIPSSSNEVGITTNQVKKVKGSANRMLSSEHTTFATVVQEKKLVAEPGGGKTHRAAVSIGDRKEEALRPVAEGKSRNPNSTETSKPTVSHSKSIEVGGMQNDGKRVEESSNRMLSEQATLAKVAKDETLVVETGGGKAHMEAASIGDGSIPPVSCPIKDDDNCKSKEPMVNSATGSQFEQKTFCRVRDGETVQVKYKVYIPKKTPALERRQLQR